MKEFAKKLSKDDGISCLHIFAKKQVFLAAVGLQMRISKKKLSYIDVRDYLENLACLVDFLDIQSMPASQVRRKHNYLPFQTLESSRN